VAEINWTLLFIVSVIFFPIAVWGVYKVVTSEGRVARETAKAPKTSFKLQKQERSNATNIVTETLGKAVLDLYKKYEDLSEDQRRTRKTVEYLHGTFKDYVLPTLKDLKREVKLGKAKKSA